MITQLISNTKKKPSARSKKLSRDDWVSAARKALISGGIEAITIDSIAKENGVTRGGFYWHFTDRADLLRGLLRHWEDVNTEPMIKAAEKAGERGLKEDFAPTIGLLWSDEKDFSPSFDSAVRNWAQADVIVRNAVQRVDERRISAFQKMFEQYGYTGKAALVRARITYFHQVGYYALSIQETQEQRLDLATFYDEVLLY